MTTSLFNVPFPPIQKKKEKYLKGKGVGPPEVVTKTPLNHRKTRQ